MTDQNNTLVESERSIIPIFSLSNNLFPVGYKVVKEDKFIAMVGAEVIGSFPTDKWIVSFGNNSRKGKEFFSVEKALAYALTVQVA